MDSQIIITTAGLQELINAELNGTSPVELTQVGFGTGQYTPSESQTSLQNEFKRLNANALSGGNVGDNTIYISALDASLDEYDLFEYGVYTENGTLLAVCSQNTPILKKSAGSQALLDIEFVLTNVNPESVTLGDTNFSNPPATETTQGVLEIASSAEVADAVSGSYALTPSNLRYAFNKLSGTTGAQKLPSGLIMQWGKALVSPTGTDVLFPTTFPNACRNVTANVIDSNVGVPVFVDSSSVSISKVKFKHNGNGGINIYWMAIGE